MPNPDQTALDHLRATLLDCDRAELIRFRNERGDGKAEIVDDLMQSPREYLEELQDQLFDSRGRTPQQKHVLLNQLQESCERIGGEHDH